MARRRRGKKFAPAMRRSERGIGPATPPSASAPSGFRCLDRRTLLLGTALASTLLAASLVAPRPAIAVVGDCDLGGLEAVYISDNVSVECINSIDRVSEPPVFNAAIHVDTVGPGNSILINNSATLTVDNLGVGVAYGIDAYTYGNNSAIDIVNSGDIIAAGDIAALGIFAETDGNNSTIDIVNSGDITAAGDFAAYGIFATTYGVGSDISIVNSGDINANFGKSPLYGFDNAITAISFSGDITIANSGALKAATDGIYALSNYGEITVVNSGPIQAGYHGINAVLDQGSVSITNSGSIEAGEVGIYASTYVGGVVIKNSGDIDAGVIGISAINDLGDIKITNTGTIDPSVGIVAINSFGLGNSVEIDNSGTVEAKNLGVAAFSIGYNNSIVVNNSGSVKTTGTNTVFDYTSLPGCGCFLYGFSFLSGGSIGIAAGTIGVANSITIVNSGTVEAFGRYGTGIAAVAYYGPASPTTIVNTGSVYGSHTGIFSANPDGTTIINTGDISAGSHLAINVESGPVDIFNSGTITGFVRLDADDRFINQAGGVFEARQTSDFDAYGTGGNDLFRNEAGGTVHALNHNGQPTAFVNLDRFENSGLISMVDGRPGDIFFISNTPGGSDLSFAASGNSTLAVDAFLGGPNNSASDVFIIDGNVSGTTAVQVNNTNSGPGVFNPSGVPVVFVTGNTPNPNAFHMDPIDTGFFDYDLFFTPTGSGFWEFRSYPGAGAHLLPQLLTAAQDIWHQTSSTWFDRTADLRVLLAGGAAPSVYDPGGKSLGAAPGAGLTPAVWARGGGSWLDRDDSVSTTAYGRNYTFDLDRDLQVIDFQMGLDLGTRDLFSQGDVLVFGVLGGFVHADLDYDAIARQFDFSGGQVGAYATYLKGGLFVDTLLNAHIYELDTATLGFPSSLDANTIGLRTDTGYRFGSFSGGPFIEPLATIEVTWADIDGFSLGGNTVSFDDDANVRGRLGLRAGTTTQAWEGTMMEPFVIGSLWGNLTDANQATLVSSGRTFRFEDQLEDVWGEVSAGVNFFNPTAATAVFAKVDVTFGDDLTGVGGKAGMRVNW